MDVSKRGRDWTGERVGHLVVTQCVGKTPTRMYIWECACDCGKQVNKTSGILQRGCTYCSHTCTLRPTNRTHGQSYTREYRAWVSMKSRCYTKSHKNYDEYAGRGVSVCPQWVDNFEQFYADVGPAPTDKHTVDRIDVDGNYEPGNVRWATQAEQNLNRRNTLRAEVRGELLPLKTIGEKYGVAYAAVFSRFKNGLRGDDLITRQKIGRKPKPKTN